MHTITFTALSLRRGLHLMLLIGLLGLLSIAYAARPAAQAAPVGGSVWMAASNKALDQMRGGFSVGTGLMVSFGISRAVYINGDLVTSMSFNIGQVSELTPTQVADINRVLATLGPIQNGPGNTVPTNQAPTVPGGGGANSASSNAATVNPASGNASGAGGASVTITPGATVIQNSLNHQQIISQTVISATSNAASIINALNLQNTINEAINKAIGQR